LTQRLDYKRLALAPKHSSGLVLGPRSAQSAAPPSLHSFAFALTPFFTQPAADSLQPFTSLYITLLTSTTVFSTLARFLTRFYHATRSPFHSPSRYRAKEKATALLWPLLSAQNTSTSTYESLHNHTRPISHAPQTWLVTTTALRITCQTAHRTTTVTTAEAGEVRGCLRKMRIGNTRLSGVQRRHPRLPHTSSTSSASRRRRALNLMMMSFSALSTS
jgi:hypothetical protein